MLGAAYFVGDLEHAAACVIGRARAREGGFICVSGVHGIITAQHRPALMAALEASWLNLPDGFPVAWLMRHTGTPAARRVAGPDLMPQVIDRGREHHLRHYFLGSTPEVLEQLCERTDRRFPGAVIAGAMSPPFRDLSAAESATLLGEIDRAQPDIIWVALGAPKQEEWMHRHAAHLWPALAIGVGAAFEFEARAKPRAPDWMQRHGLEWLHRLAREPRRLGYRYLTTNSEFLLRAAVVMIRART